MNGDDLELNTVRRFAKRVSNLTLEEQGHCEVPAGCGGVVLRWRSPDFGFPVTIRTYAEKDAAIFLDGQPVAIGRMDLSYGPHVLAVRLTYRDQAPLFMAVVAEIQSHVRPPAEPPAAMPAPWRLTTVADGSWRSVPEMPGDEAWMRPGYDDSQWAPLQAAPAASAPDSAGNWIRALADAGAVLLAPADVPSPTRFTLGALVRRLGLRKPPERHHHIRCAFDVQRPA